MALRRYAEADEGGIRAARESVGFHLAAPGRMMQSIKLPLPRGAVRTDDALKVRFSTTLGEELEIELFHSTKAKPCL